jgi:hypothetical protein
MPAFCERPFGGAGENRESETRAAPRTAELSSDREPSTQKENGRLLREQPPASEMAGSYLRFASVKSKENFAMNAAPHQEDWP